VLDCGSAHGLIPPWAQPPASMALSTAPRMRCPQADVIGTRSNAGSPFPPPQVLVGGFKDGKAFLGHLDMIGTAFSDEVMATGFGSYLALPIMRKRWHANMTEGEARALLEDCMRVLFYRWGPREGGREGGRKGEGGRLEGAKQPRTQKVELYF